MRNNSLSLDGLGRGPLYRWAVVALPGLILQQRLVSRDFVDLVIVSLLDCSGSSSLASPACCRESTGNRSQNYTDLDLLPFANKGVDF